MFNPNPDGPLANLILMGGGRKVPAVFIIAYYSKNRAYNLYQYIYVNSLFFL